MGDDLPYVDLGTSEKAIAVAVGSFHSCALLYTGNLKCWGAWFSFVFIIVVVPGFPIL